MLRKGSLPHTCHVSLVTCHVLFHVSYVTCHFFLIFFYFFGQSVEGSQRRVCYQWGYPDRVVPRLVYTDMCAAFVWISSWQMIIYKGQETGKIDRALLRADLINLANLSGRSQSSAQLPSVKCLVDKNLQGSRDCPNELKMSASADVLDFSIFKHINFCNLSENVTNLSI